MFYSFLSYGDHVYTVVLLAIKIHVRKPRLAYFFNTFYTHKSVRRQLERNTAWWNSCHASSSSTRKLDAPFLAIRNSTMCVKRKSSRGRGGCGRWQGGVHWRRKRTRNGSIFSFLLLFEPITETCIGHFERVSQSAPNHVGLGDSLVMLHRSRRYDPLTLKYTLTKP